MLEKKNSKQDTFVNDIYNKTNKIARIAFRLDELCNALFRVGNEQLGRELSIISDALLEAQKAIEKAVGVEVHRQVMGAGE